MNSISVLLFHFLLRTPELSEHMFRTAWVVLLLGLVSTLLLAVARRHTSVGKRVTNWFMLSMGTRPNGLVTLRPHRRPPLRHRRRRPQMTRRDRSPSHLGAVVASPRVMLLATRRPVLVFVDLLLLHRPLRFLLPLACCVLLDVERTRAWLALWRQTWLRAWAQIRFRRRHRGRCRDSSAFCLLRSVPVGMATSVVGPRRRVCPWSARQK